MNVDEKLSIIKKYLKKKKEKNVVELIIKDYNQANFYIALVFSSHIEKFKVLFIPLDIMDCKNVESYCCYQFINISMVNYILETMNNSKNLYMLETVRDKTNKKISSYYVEINTHVGGEDYTFKTTQYIPKEWMFMFEIIMLLFEHAPNVLNELSRELLAVLNNSAEMIEYRASFTFDLFNDNLEKLFTQEYLDAGKRLYENNLVEFLEKVNDKYFAIVDGHIVIIEYNEHKKILNLYCDCACNVCGSHIYAALKSIINNKICKFFKIVVAEDSDDFIDNSGMFKYYLCYGIDDNSLKVIHGSSEELLPLSMVYDGLIKICDDPDLILENSIKTRLNDIYSHDDVLKVIDNIRGEFPN